MCRPRAFVSWFSRLRANPGVRRGSGFFVFVCACSPVRECRRAGFRHGEEDGERWEDPATAYSPTCGHAVPSALRGFTAEFGMGSGGAPSLRSPGRRNAPGFFSGGFGILAISWRGASSLERLGPVSSTHCCASTSGLSTWWSSTALMARPGFEVGFPLRCLQRLSRPDVATRLRGWRHDRSTRGPSTPVLSY